MNKNRLLKKAICFVIIVFFTGVTIIPTTATTTFEILSTGNIIYVGGSGPGNYTYIQDAIDNASDGDTVFVYNGTYYEHLRVDKDINLIGEDRDTTFIDGGGEDTAVKIGADVTLSGFTIQNSEEGIKNFIPAPPNNIYKFTVSGNIIKNNKNGIAIGGSKNHIIYRNNITNNELGINLFFTSDCEINNNNFISNEKHAYFEYLFFFQILPRNNWNGNYWDDWNLQIPKPIRGLKIFMIVLRPMWPIKILSFSWFNFDWSPARESHDIGV